jgi:predicted RNA binding protein YcfA (HicA-like mRNA interferase family)
MAVVQTYNTLINQIQQTLPVKRITRMRNLAWLMCGILWSHSVHLSKIANKMLGTAKRRSWTRRLSRFLHNPHVHVRKWYRPIAKGLIKEVAGTVGEVRLIIDATKVTNSHQLLMVALAYRRRALPLVWTWMRCKKGHSSARKQRALLDYVHRLVPADVTVVLTGDSEFTPLQALLEEWGWYYVLRQKGSHLIRLHPQAVWQRVDSLVTQPGQHCWLGAVELTKKHQHQTNFLAYWKPGFKDPWLLATNLPTMRATRCHYKRRMWIEEMFGDFKRHGFDLERSRLQHFLPLSRLTLAVALLYVWLVSVGASTIKRGDRHLVDRRDRRDLSVFRIGYDIFERFVINGQSVSIRPCPYF